jgi:hypothetical protein
MLGGIIAIAGGLLLVLGAFLPWVTVRAALLGSLSVSGMEGDGIFFLIGGLLVAALGLWSILGTPSAAPQLLILSGVGFGALAIFEFSNVSDGIGGIESEFAAASMGPGILTLLAGAAAILVAGFTLRGHMTPVSAEPAPGQDAFSPDRPVRECPHCKEAMRRDASVCRHCRRGSPPWEFENGRWWTSDPAGQRVWLDEASRSWHREKGSD